MILQIKKRFGKETDLQNKLSVIDETMSSIDYWLDMISNFENITKFDREIVCGLVESITVFSFC